MFERENLPQSVSNRSTPPPRQTVPSPLFFLSLNHPSPLSLACCHALVPLSICPSLTSHSCSLPTFHLPLQFPFWRVLARRSSIHLRRDVAGPTVQTSRRLLGCMEGGILRNDFVLWLRRSRRESPYSSLVENEGRGGLEGETEEGPMGGDGTQLIVSLRSSLAGTM